MRPELLLCSLALAAILLDCDATPTKNHESSLYSQQMELFQEALEEKALQGDQQAVQAFEDTEDAREDTPLSTAFPLLKEDLIASSSDPQDTAGDAALSRLEHPYKYTKAQAADAALYKAGAAISQEEAAAKRTAQLPPLPAGTPPPKRHTVLVLGAGASGVSAAADLAARGVDVALLEAGDYVGGRMHAQDFHGTTVDLGASWVHGAESNYVMWPYVEMLGVQGAVTNYSNIPGSKVPNVLMAEMHNGDARPVPRDLNDKWSDRFDKALKACTAEAEALDKDECKKDRSTAWCLRKMGYWKGVKPYTVQHRIANYYTWELVDFEDGPRPKELSTCWSYPTNPGMKADVDYFVTDPRGYGMVLRHIGKDIMGAVHLNHRVTNIAHTPTGVRVKATRTAPGESPKEVFFDADYVITTFSLGVLKAANKEKLFTPPLPAWKEEGIQRMGFGNYGKMFARFKEGSKLWPKATEIFKLAQDNIAGGLPPWGVNLDHPKYRPGSGVISFHIAGKTCRRIEGQSKAKNEEDLMTTLTALLGEHVKLEDGTETLIPTKPESLLTTSWSTNPLFRGSYSYWPLGMQGRHFHSIKRPLGRVHFAGEHTSEDHFAFVHGAILSGRRAAKEVLAVIARG
jgi:polyamine oxidase